jgi:hypothetical protein
MGNSEKGVGPLMRWYVDNICLNSERLTKIEVPEKAIMIALPAGSIGMETDGICVFSHKGSTGWWDYCVAITENMEAAAIAQELLDTERRGLKDIMARELPDWIRDQQYDIYWVNGDERTIIE